MIEGLAHLPTFWLEWALSAERKTDYDVVFLDRNSTRGNVSLRAFPVYAFDDRLLRQEPFRQMSAISILRIWTKVPFTKV